MPFMAVASRALSGDVQPCPKCKGEVRAYFHVFNRQKSQGSLWAWCSACGIYTTLARVQPTATFHDPFADLSLEQFASLEADPREPMLDRLERLWCARGSTSGFGVQSQDQMGRTSTTR